MNFFNAGDLVECIQEILGYGFKKGDVYRVRRAATGPYIYPPRSSSSFGVACDHPLILKHFRLAPSTVQTPAASVASSPPTTKFQVGDRIRCVSLSVGPVSPRPKIGQEFIVSAVNYTGRADLISLAGHNNYVHDGAFDLVSPMNTGIPVAVPPTGYQVSPYGAFMLSSGLSWSTPHNSAPPSTGRWARVYLVDAAPKCECGSDKLGHPGHSTWCGKFSAA